MNEARNAIDLIIHAPEKLLRVIYRRFLLQKQLNNLKSVILNFVKKPLQRNRLYRVNLIKKWQRLNWRWLRKTLSCWKRRLHASKGELFLKRDKIVTIKKVLQEFLLLLLFMLMTKRVQKIRHLYDSQAERESKKILNRVFSKQKNLLKKKKRKWLRWKNNRLKWKNKLRDGGENDESSRSFFRSPL